ncbi:MAG: sugar ABC transporter permease [Armatimonadota bacterium]|nr:sugar ABC transporter permease [Armatimonadota bacterium]
MTTQVPALSVTRPAPPRPARRRTALVALFLGPFVLLTVVFFVIPAVLTGLLGLTDLDASFQGGVVGLANFRGFAADPLLPRVLLNTVVYVFFTLMCFNVGMGLVLALMTTQIPDRVGTVFRAIWLLPRLTPQVVYALLWLWFVDPTKYGFLNTLRGWLGLAPLDLISWSPWLVIVIVNGLIGASLGMVIFTSAIKSVPEDYIRAARVDGASTFHIIRYVILPLIRWPVTFVIVYQTLALLTSYEYILLVTGGGPFYDSTVYALYVFKRAIENGDYGYGAALAFVLVLVGAIAAQFYWRFLNFERMITQPKIESD